MPALHAAQRFGRAREVRGGALRLALQAGERAARARGSPASCFSEGRLADTGVFAEPSPLASSIEPASACVAPFLSAPAPASAWLSPADSLAEPLRAAASPACSSPAPDWALPEPLCSSAGAGARRAQAALQLLGAAAGLAESVDEALQVALAAGEQLARFGQRGRELAERLVCALSSPGPVTAATLRSRRSVPGDGRAPQARGGRDRSARVDDDQVVGVGQPGPITRATVSKDLRAGSPAGS